MDTKDQLNKIVLNYISGNASYYDSLLAITDITNALNIVFADEAIEALRTEYKRVLKAS